MERLPEISLPDWIKTSPHQLFPDAEAVLVQLENNERLVITRYGLDTFPDHFSTPDHFTDWKKSLISDSNRRQRNNRLRVPDKWPNTMYYQEPRHRGLVTSLTVSTINEKLNPISFNYVFKPIRIFWSMADIIHMELVQTQTVQTSVDYKLLLRGQKDIGEDIKALGLGIRRINPGHILYRGPSSRNLPILSAINIPGQVYADI